MLILLCAVFFSLITTFSRFAYDAGANPLTLVEARSAAFVIVIGAFQLLARRSFALPRRTLIATFPMSIGIMAMSIGYLSSVTFIKVSLAVVLLYSFPLMVGILAAVSGRERIALPKALALLVAFGGLVMAIGLETESVDWRGVALVLLAALGIAGNLTFTGPYLAGVDSLTVNVWNNFWGAAALGAYLALSGGVSLPATELGWAALGGVGRLLYFGPRPDVRRAQIPRAEPGGGHVEPRTGHLDHRCRPPLARGHAAPAMVGRPYHVGRIVLFRTPVVPGQKPDPGFMRLLHFRDSATRRFTRGSTISRGVNPKDRQILKFLRCVTP